MFGSFRKKIYLCSLNYIIVRIMDTLSNSAAPKKRISRTMEWALSHKWMIEVVDPELQAQCKSYKDGKKIIRHEVDA